MAHPESLTQLPADVRTDNDSNYKPRSEQVPRQPKTPNTLEETMVQTSKEEPSSSAATHARKEPMPISSPTSSKVMRNSKREKQTLSAVQAQLIIHPGMQVNNCTLFGSLGPEVRFRKLGMLLETFDSNTGKVLRSANKLAVEAVICLCMNDNTSIKDATGRMHHVWGRDGYFNPEFSRPLMFANRKFSKTERKEYESWPPSQRLKASNVYMQWHFDDPFTEVISLRFIAMEGSATSNELGVRQKSFYVAGDTVEEAKQDKSRVLIWWKPKLILTSVKELLNLSHWPNHKPTDQELRLNGPRNRLKGKKDGHKKGYQRFALYFFSGSRGCKDWVAARELAGPYPEEALRKALVDDTDTGELVEDWSKVYDRVVPA